PGLVERVHRAGRLRRVQLQVGLVHLVEEEAVDEQLAARTDVRYVGRRGQANRPDQRADREQCDGRIVQFHGCASCKSDVTTDSPPADELRELGPAAVEVDRLSQLPSQPVPMVVRQPIGLYHKKLTVLYWATSAVTVRPRTVPASAPWLVARLLKAPSK